MFIYERHFLGEYLIPRHFKLLSRLEATTGELDTGKCSLPPQTLALDSRAAHDNRQSASDKQICGIVCVRNEFVLLKFCLNLSLWFFNEFLIRLNLKFLIPFNF